jgi:hypothetical protein
MSHDEDESKSPRSLSLDSQQLSQTQTPSSSTGIPEADIFTPSMMAMIQTAKENNVNAFQSYWEADENDISGWSEGQISQDPAKQLVTYAENGQLDEIKLLFEKINDPQDLTRMLMFKDSDGYSAMHRAAYSNMLHVIKFLVAFEFRADMGSELNQLAARTDMGWTPLHSAVYWNSFRVVEYLLKHGQADANLKSNSGQTCLHLAAQNSNTRESLLLLLFSPGVDFTIRNDQNERAYDIAIRCSKYNALFEITEPHLNEI